MEEEQYCARQRQLEKAGLGKAIYCLTGGMQVVGNPIPYCSKIKSIVYVKALAFCFVLSWRGLVYCSLGLVGFGVLVLGLLWLVGVVLTRKMEGGRRTGDQEYRLEPL